MNEQINKTKLWIDTDPGHDDVMALLLLVNDPRVEIVGLSTVFGNASLPQVTRNAKYILQAANRRDIPIFAGAQQPLIRDQIKSDVHGESGFDGVIMQASEEVIADEAQGKLIEAIENSLEPITILALGPLTNIAKLFTSRPDLIGKIEKIVIMGGAISVPGNKSRVAEFNIFCDPEAAEIVFNLPVEKILIPLDPCNQIVLTETDIENLLAGKIGSMLKRALKPYVENICIFEGVKGALMYDPIAAYVLLEPDAFKMEPMDVRVETSSKGFTYGMTVAERRAVAPREENMKVVTAVDRERFVIDLLSAIKKLDEALSVSAAE